MKFGFRILAGIVLAGTTAGLGAPARADIVEFDLRATPTLERRFSAAAGDFVELCGSLRRGQSIDWRFEADAPLDFNIHYHVGDDVKSPVERSAVRRLRGRLAVSADQDYCWMWTNRGTTTLTLRARLHDGSRRARPSTARPGGAVSQGD